jgi:hypothetical protein
MLVVDKSRRSGAKQWCKYCNVFVPNNPKCLQSHNKQITHQVNVRQFEQSKRRQRVAEERNSAHIDCELEKIRARAQEQFLKQDVCRDQSASLQSQSASQQEEYEMARSLYGDDLLRELTEPVKKVNPVEAYNNFMKSLPTKIPKKYKTTVGQLKE